MDFEEILNNPNLKSWQLLQEKEEFYRSMTEDLTIDKATRSLYENKFIELLKQRSAFLRKFNNHYYNKLELEEQEELIRDIRNYRATKGEEYTIEEIYQEFEKDKRKDLKDGAN